MARVPRGREGQRSTRRLEGWAEAGPPRALQITRREGADGFHVGIHWHSGKIHSPAVGGGTDQRGGPGGSGDCWGTPERVSREGGRTGSHSSSASDFSLWSSHLENKPHIFFFPISHDPSFLALSSFWHLCSLQMNLLQLFTKAYFLPHDGEGTSSPVPQPPAFGISTVLPGPPEDSSLLPPTTPEPEVTVERGWLLSRAVSMETTVLVGEQQEAGVPSHPPWEACDKPWRLPPLPSSAPGPGHPRFLSCPTSGLPANPVASTFQRLWPLPTVSSFHCGQSWSQLTWITAVLSQVVSLLLPFSLNQSCSSFTQNYLMSWDSPSMKAMFHVMSYMSL